MPNNFKQHLQQVLKSDDRLWYLDDETKATELNQTLLIDLAEHYDPQILALLFADQKCKAKFFVQVGEHYVFKSNDFQFFLEEHKVDNSYTTYKNRIGLTDGKRFLKDSQDVVLNFPFKDCILQGGQSTEEGQDSYFEYDQNVTATNKKKGYRENTYNQKQAKRREIFFNEILAADEIDRLKDEKALVNWKRFSKDGAQEVGEIARDSDGTIRENLIIKGNNYLALHSLKKQFVGKIKLIYIDPPYNRSGNADSFIYNNTFKRSTWLTFMKNRLEVAKQLLADKGAIIIAIDGTEFFYLGVLIDELFPKYENHCITIIHNPGGNQGTNFSYTHEYAFFIIPQNLKTIGLQDRRDKPDIRPLRDVSTGDHLRTDAKNCFYPILVRDNEIIGFGDVCPDNFHPSNANITKDDGLIEIYPIDPQGIERKWVFARQTVESIKNELKVEFNKKRKIWDIKRHKTMFNYKTVWTDKKYDSNQNGAKLLKKLIPDNKFTFPKSLWNVYDCIYSVVGQDQNAIILDYHAGSGTTAHAVLELNKEDGGNRKFIMVEQMDYISTVTCPRVQKVIQQENVNDNFIYFELAKWNEQAKQQILSCKSLAELKTFFAEIADKYFLNYNVKIKEFKEKVIEEAEFKNLSLDQQKNMFITMLDLNQMVVNRSEMGDEKFGISKSDREMTGEFYKDEIR